MKIKGGDTGESPSLVSSSPDSPSERQNNLP